MGILDVLKLTPEKLSAAADGLAGLLNEIRANARESADRLPAVEARLAAIEAQLAAIGEAIGILAGWQREALELQTRAPQSAAPAKEHDHERSRNGGVA